MLQSTELNPFLPHLTAVIRDAKKLHMAQNFIEIFASQEAKKKMA